MPQTQSISKACFISILKSGIPLLVLKGTKDTPATALCGGRSRIRKRSWKNRSCFPLLCRGHALGFVQEGQRLLKSLTEGGFGCLVTPRTVLNFIYRKKKILWAKKMNIILDFCSSILYKIMWRLLLVSPALHRGGRSHPHGCLLFGVTHICTVIPLKVLSSI